MKRRNIFAALFASAVPATYAQTPIVQSIVINSGVSRSDLVEVMRITSEQAKAEILEYARRGGS